MNFLTKLFGKKEEEEKVPMENTESETMTNETPSEEVSSEEAPMMNESSTEDETQQ